MPGSLPRLLSWQASGLANAIATLGPGMYLAHYGLTEPPFSITPDPRFVFLSERHRDALAHLLFGVGQGGGGGFVQLTGEVGTGKTTLCRVLLEQLPDDTRIALVLNPQLSPIELLETICEELGLDLAGHQGSRKLLVDLLNRYLLKAYALGLHVVLIIDEAQNLSVEALEQVRLLTNLETPTRKLLQILLLGQPELRTMLARDDLRQLAQRITARYHLTPLDEVETGEYLRHRWRVAGGQRFPYTAKAVARIHRHAGGVPRLINVIAERALLAGYAHDETILHERWVDRAAREALAPTRRGWRFGRIGIGIGSAVAIAATLVALLAAAPAWRRSSPVAADANAAVTAPVAVTRPATAPMPATPPITRIGAADLSQRLRAAGTAPLPAWRALLTLWQLPAGEADVVAASACGPTVAADIHCVGGRAGFDKLAAQGRPALLRLREGDHEAWAVLLGIDVDSARLQLGDRVFDIDLIAVERVWAGDYVALWRTPEGVEGMPVAALTRGSRGPLVDWIHTKLLPSDPAANSAPLQVDTAMLDAVRGYQRARGLTPDGVVGPETLMALSSGEAGPRLLRVLE